MRRAEIQDGWTGRSRSSHSQLPDKLAELSSATELALIAVGNVDATLVDWHIAGSGGPSGERQ